MPRPRSAIRRCLAVAVTTTLLVAGLAAPAGADHRDNHANPCEGAASASDIFADYERARDVHQASIDCALHRAITNGAGTNNDGERVYKPGASVTRAQMAQFIVNTLVAAGYDEALPEGAGEDRFDDIRGNFARVAINRLADAGIVSGTDADSYSPGDVIRRQQMASFIVQAVNWATNPDVRGDDVERFTDVGAANVHKPNIESGADTGLFQGTSASTFDPGRVVVRDQMATFLVTLLRHIYAEADAPEPYTATITVDDTTVDAGSDVTGEVTGSNITGVEVRGCSVGTRALEDVDPVAGGIQFSFRIPASRDPGGCTLRFTITFNNGAQAEAEQPMTILRPNASNLDVDSTSIPAGGVLTGEVRGSDVASVSVSGCSFFNEPVDDRDTGTDGIQFSETVSRHQSPGDCTLSFRVTYTDSRFTDEAVEVAITPASGQTRRPELVAARVVATTSPEDATAENPAGTTVRFYFDEPVAAATSAAAFAVYAADGVRIAGDGTPEIGSNDTRVLVHFPTVTSPADAADLTLAAVDAGAVADEQDQTNPVGAATLRSGQPPQTDGPDLTTVTIVSGSSSAGDFASANYVFDEDLAAAGADPSRFLLYLAGGTQLTCSAAGFEVGSTGDQRRQATCQGFTTAAGTAATPAQIAAAVLAAVDNGAVDDREAGTALNAEGAVATNGGTGQAAQ